MYCFGWVCCNVIFACVVVVGEWEQQWRDLSECQVAFSWRESAFTLTLLARGGGVREICVTAAEVRCDFRANARCSGRDNRSVRTLTACRDQFGSSIWNGRTKRPVIDLYSCGWG